MAETQRRDSQEQDAEKAQEKRKPAEPAPEHVKALAGESILFPGLLDDPAMGLPIERHAALLGDPRFSHSVNNSQKAGLVTELQQNYGNAYVRRVVGRIQAKKDKAIPEEEQDIADIGQRIAKQKGSGQPLAPETRSEMEAAFGRGLSEVRIHSDSQTQRSAEKLGARAFAVGSDIFVPPTEPSLESEQGKELLAHELAHVVQQDEGRTGALIGTGGDAGARAALEAEAESAARHVASGQHQRQETMPSRQIQTTPHSAGIGASMVNGHPPVAQMKKGSSDMVTIGWTLLVGPQPPEVNIEEWEIQGRRGSDRTLPSIVADAFKTYKGNINLSVDTSTVVGGPLGKLQPAITGANSWAGARAPEDRWGNTQLTIPAEAFASGGSGWNTIKAVFTHEYMKAPLVDEVKIYSHAHEHTKPVKIATKEWVDPDRAVKNPGPPETPPVSVKKAVTTGLSFSTSDMTTIGKETAYGFSVTAGGKLGLKKGSELSAEMGFSYQAVESIAKSVGATRTETEQTTEEVTITAGPNQIAMPMLRDIHYKAKIIVHDRGIDTGERKEIFFKKTVAAGQKVSMLPSKEAWHPPAGAAPAPGSAVAPGTPPASGTSPTP